MATEDVEFTEAFFKQMLKSDPAWICRGILAVYERQTEDEKLAETTSHKNRVGFSGVDAKFLSSLAKQIQRNLSKEVPLARCLSAKQLEYAKKLMPKYAGQLLQIARNNQKQPPAEVEKVPDNKHPGFRIIYPDVYTVSAAKMRSWAADAYEDGQISGPLDLTIDQLAKQLEDEGLITLDHQFLRKVGRE